MTMVQIITFLQMKLSRDKTMKTQNLHTPIIMMAFNWSELPAVDMVYADHILSEYQHKSIDGVYQGTTEPAYLINLITEVLQREQQIDNLITLGQLHQQECILYSDEYRETWLIDCMTSERTNIGKLKQVAKREALSSDNHTFDPSTNTYWIAS